MTYLIFKKELPVGCRTFFNHTKIKKESLTSVVLRPSLIAILSIVPLCANAATPAITPPVPSNRTPNVPGIIQPGVIQQRVQLPKPTPTGISTPVVFSTPSGQFPVEQARKVHFVLRNVIFVGNTVIKSDELRQIFAPYFNREITLATLQDLTQAVTAKYRSEGYIISRAIIPPQTIKGGTVKIQIIEGYIDKVEVKSNSPRLVPLLQTMGNHILASRPLKMNVIEKFLLLANSIPGVSTQGVLTPSKTAPGAADLTMVSDLDRINGYVAYDNFSTRYLGPREASAGLTLNSILLPGDSTTIQMLAATKKDEMYYGQVQYLATINSYGTTADIGTYYSRTKPGFVLRPADIIGITRDYYLDFDHPFIRSRTQNLYGHFNFNYMNSESTILGQSFYDDRIRSIQFGERFNLVDKYRGLNEIDLNVEQGLPIFGNSGDTDISRPKGKSVFTKLSGTISRLQLIGQRFSLLAAVNGQFSFEPLLAEEQYAYGGPIYGRGYDPSEIVGDQGIAGKLELRMDSTFTSAPQIRALQWYAFYDAGQIWNKDKITQLPEASAISAGIGFRLNAFDHFKINMYAAKPLTRDVQAKVLANENGKSIRTFFQLFVNF